VTVEQVRMAGVTAGQQRWMTRSGRWVPLRPGVYAVVGSVSSRMQQVAATALSLHPGAWLSHGTAGWLWGFPGLEEGRIEVLTGLERRVTLDGVRNHRSRCLFSADLTERGRLPITSPERTLVDISGRMGPSELARALDDGMRRRVVRLERMRRCADRLACAPGRRLAIVQELLAERLPGYDPGDSDLETRVLRLILNSGFPVPIQQYRVRLGGRTFRLDLAYPDVRLAVELDGWEYHRSRTAFDNDRSRANALVAAGWSVIRFTSRSSDGEILACIRAARQAFGRFGAA
jgi:very-short-patch-repair endonuclease